MSSKFELSSCKRFSLVCLTTNLDISSPCNFWYYLRCLTDFKTWIISYSFWSFSSPWSYNFMSFLFKIQDLFWKNICKLWPHESLICRCIFTSFLCFFVSCYLTFLSSSSFLMTLGLVDSLNIELLLVFAIYSLEMALTLKWCNATGYNINITSPWTTMATPPNSAKT